MSIEFIPLFFRGVFFYGGIYMSMHDYPCIEAWVSVIFKGSDSLSDGTPLEEVISVVNE